MQGDKGKIEFLSIGDYGKENNIKADFLGLKEEIKGVPDVDIMPLTEKWVITVSTQYGCSMGCLFCDVPKVGKGVNATLNDLSNQVTQALGQHPEILATKRLNLHYARMGEPTFNKSVLLHAKGLLKEVRPFINRSHVHPVVSTMMPKKNKYLMEFLQEWCEIKNYNFRGAAGLQLSINSTDDAQRNKMFMGSSLSLKEISDIAKLLPDPKGRKYCLNFALFDDTIINAEKLLSLFSKDKFMVKITPMHNTTSCADNKIVTTGGYYGYTPYKDIEIELIKAGFDVLVFIPSIEEEESKITCGNAILKNFNI
jgi:23S rRNA (adenine2503-C2)-methyltransferase